MYALETGMRRRPWAAWTWVSGLAGAAVAILALVFLLKGQEASNQHHPMLEDLELMTSTENVELSEDLEFYDWLAESASFPPAKPAVIRKDSVFQDQQH